MSFVESDHRTFSGDQSVRGVGERLPPTEGDVEDVIAIHRWEGEGGSGAGEDSSTHTIRTGSGLNRKEAVLAKPVYPLLARHQVAEKDWEHADLSVLLHEWYGRFNARFHLNLPVTPLRLDPTIRRNCAGYFRPGYNEFGLVYEIAIRVPPLDPVRALDVADILGTLLHEQLHLLQELTGVAGRNNYHNAQFRATAERFGLSVDHRGHQTYEPASPFLDLLAEFGIDPPCAVTAVRTDAPGGVAPGRPPKSPGRSKLAKWSCGCTNARVGVTAFHARCTRPDCGRPFVRC